MERRRGMSPVQRGGLGIVSLCLILVCINAAWAAVEPAPPSGLVALNPPITMPSFRLPNVDGEMIASSGLKGKVVVVRFWATW